MRSIANGEGESKVRTYVFFVCLASNRTHQALLLEEDYLPVSRRAFQYVKLHRMKNTAAVTKLSNLEGEFQREQYLFKIHARLTRRRGQAYKYRCIALRSWKPLTLVRTSELCNPPQAIVNLQYMQTCQTFYFNFPLCIVCHVL